MTPFGVKNKFTDTTIPVPCGKCPACKKRRASAWSFRLMQEHKRCKTAYFITLTYDTAHVPITKNGFMDIRKRDIQLFFKRLRKDHEHPDNRLRFGKICYYAVGEYGGRFKRPHYHVIIFNAVLELIQPAWNLGQIHYGEVSEASVGYTLKYISKTSKIPMHCNDVRTPEFSLMSKGIGDNYLTPEMVRWHNQSPDHLYCQTADGKKISMPRYYKNKIYSEYKRKAYGAKARIKQEERIEKDIQKVGFSTYYQNKAAGIEAAFRKQKVRENDNQTL